MKDTIFDFLKLASEDEGLAREFHELAAKYNFEFIQSEELSEEELGNVAGGFHTFSDIFEIPPTGPQPGSF